MKTYKLYKDKLTGQIVEYALELLDGVATGVHVNRKLNEDYLKWLAEGNTPLPADE